MNKVTYLIGAGASCHCLPLVEEIPQSLLDFQTLLTENIPTESHYHSTYYKMLEDLQVLIQNAKTHSSIDTYAKKIFIIHEGNPSPPLLSLKILLSFCFIYEQIRYPLDTRYDTFFASILKDRADRFNGDIRIVSWNYDYQFEKAHRLYTGEKSLITTQKNLPVIPNEDYKGGSIDKFSIFKINGTTSFDDRNEVDLDNFFNDLSFGVQYHKDTLPEGIRRKPGVLEKAHCQMLVKDFLEKYFRAFIEKPTIFPSLNFSWESKEGANSVLNAALSSIKGSNTLVIIGYSFPFFNRNIDKKIINSLATERKIYIQDPKFEEVKSNLASIAPRASAHCIQVTNMDQFYLPGEL